MRQSLMEGQPAHQPTLHWDQPAASRPEMGARGDPIIRFGRFCVLPRTRQLLLHEQLVEIGSRAFDLLMVLIEAPGTVIAKNEIMRRVWPDTVVEEGNLKVQMAALRKVLNKDRDFIKTVHGRGYVFTGNVTTTSVEPEALIRSGAQPTPFASESARQSDPTERRMLAPDDKPQPAVAVIDDDPDVREALDGLIRTLGLRVESFASVQEFLDKGLPDRPGCLILDVRLPGRSGLDFQEELAKSGLRLPIIFISGYADVPMSVRAMKRGAVEFLTKPVRDQDLLDAVQLAITSEVSAVSRLPREAGFD